MLLNHRSFLGALIVLSLVACGGDEGSGDGDGTDTVEPADTVSDSGAPADTVVTDTSAPADASYCAPGELFCVSAREAGVCNAAGDEAETITACAGATACEPATGLCRPTICQPDLQQCLNLSEYQLCKPDGSGWLDVQTCAPEQFCADGLCRLCQADRVECLSDATFRQCAPDSSGWSEALDCPDDHWCLDRECKPCDMTEECLNPATMRRFCANDAVEFSETIGCDAGQECSGGSCFACEPDLFQCLGERTYRECGPDGKLWGDEKTCVETDDVCMNGKCVNYWCVPRVLLLVDQSGSMGGSWDDVRDSIAALVAANPTVRFGLMSFPTGGWTCDVAGSLQVDFVQNNGDALRQWFEDNSPTGATPLAEAMRVVLENADTFFGGFGGAVVVLSDGEDTCFSGSGIKVDLAVNTSALYLDHNVASYAVGYDFGGDPEELNTIANNGGTGLQNHIPADDEGELTAAFQIIVDDFKLCEL